MFLRAVITALLLLSPAIASGSIHPEKDYQTRWCEAAGGETEFVLPDRARVDCLTLTHAVEVDFAPKWAEAIGQALYYSIATGKSPGILLIIEDRDDGRFLKRLLAVTDMAGITVWVTTQDDLPGLPKKKAVSMGSGNDSGVQKKD
ncbi:MAG: hypothetical protein A2052_06100 [Deltaproteobacteria bacterium GWA2_54_12]|nr:MAG: hypothetical protein A2052_06100 [Deltaproteobacteria bacterium GWA2_54_12]